MTTTQTNQSTALQLAVIGGHVDVVESLVKAGANATEENLVGGGGRDGEVELWRGCGKSMKLELANGCC